MKLFGFACVLIHIPTPATTVGIDENWNRSESVDPLRLISSKKVGNLSIFVDGGVLVGSSGGSVEWHAYILPETPVDCQLQADIIATFHERAVVMAVMTCDNVDHVSKLALVAFDIASGSEVSRHWIKGNCHAEEISNNKLGLENASDWRSRSRRKGELVDVLVRSESGENVWTVGRIVEVGSNRSLLVSSGIFEMWFAPDDESISPHLTFTRDWATEIRAGDYAEYLNAGGSWVLAPIEQVLASHDPRNSIKDLLVRVDERWISPDDSSKLSFCGLHVDFSDTPRHLCVKRHGNTTRIILVLERLAGLFPIVMAIDLMVREFKVAWSTVVQGCMGLLSPELLCSKDVNVDDITLISCDKSDHGDRHIFAVDGIGRRLWSVDMPILQHVHPHSAIQTWRSEPHTRPLLPSRYSTAISILNIGGIEGTLLWHQNMVSSFCSLLRFVNHKV
jgi:hypothetical protein